MEPVKKKIFVLDTNVLMHDPSSVFRFEEHDLFIPMVVLEELDGLKKGTSDAARTARQVSRLLDDLIADKDHAQIEKGLLLPTTYVKRNGGGKHGQPASGRLFFQTKPTDSALPGILPGNKPDNAILLAALAQTAQHPNRKITLVSKDINLRIKATIVGVHTEDYHNDQVLEDADLLPTGYAELPETFWESHGDKMESWQDERGRACYRVTGPSVKNLYLNQFLYLPDGDRDRGLELVVDKLDGDSATLRVIRDYRASKSPVWGIHAKNREQNFALNLLLDPDIDFVTILGTAGTGKTLLTLAAGLAQVLDEPRYREIIMTRVTVPLGEDIGFLPGTEEEKMTPWMGALMDNLEVLTQQGHTGDWERAATNDLLSKRIKIRSLNFMRGRTFLNRFIILDEAQNLTAKQMKTLVTRCGPGSKIVCLGNLSQIDTPYLSETTSGLTYVVDRFRGWQHGGHVTLARGERSRLAAHASDIL
ncbi:PhoH-like ATPase [Panacagrimonas perspica]|uniref:PhoH-like ATPase n=1 Tax=Panacagrimonas perspica TaxID=381431 RepID=A0A4S3JZU1_9GAMM|nr:PhoH family protein [Panacagrimonas perspica]TDU32851.1 PhoH-like ATPase [Panacagrimonas perspica]THD00964.1 phosphate starvation-inducible protein PhoH [Panacagrimonas perspica]